MKAKASIRLPLKTEKELAALVSALSPEVKKQIGIRSQTTMTAEGSTLVLDVEADDTVALRAALNAYLRWINSASNVLQIAKRE